MASDSKFSTRVYGALDRLGPLLAMVGVWALFAMLQWRSFATIANSQSILLQTAVVGVAALGATMIIIAGGIDLSVGSLIALVCVVTSMIIRAAGAAPEMPAGGAQLAEAATATSPTIILLLACVAGLVVAALCGLTIGTMITGRHWLVFALTAVGLGAFLAWHYGRPLFQSWPGRITLCLLAVLAALSLWADRRLRPRMMLTPFIVTLGMWGALRGTAKGLADNSAIYIPADFALPNVMQMPATPRSSAQLLAHPGDWWSPGVWIFFVLALLVAGMLRYTQFGRHIFAIGSNEQTARLCGIHVERTKLKIYAIAGLLTGTAGLLQFFFLGVGDPTTAAGFELKVIAAVVIGGASLSGVVGSVLGTVAGALMMTIIDNGCTKVGLEVWMQEIITGGIIVAAVALDQLRHRGAR
ncbi:MAG TPA: ABC transporter permease [Lacipirellulaceae bacterium]|nr:ABC transporter permease [Lacipirellulaceae bacterium]